MKATKSSTKSVDYTSNKNAPMKADFLYKKQSLITKLKIINILDKRKAKKNFNLSSDRSLDKLEIVCSQGNLKSKTPKNFTQSQLSSNNFIRNFNNDNINSTNAKDININNFLSENNLNSINNRPVYSAINNAIGNSDINYARKHSTKKSLNYNSNNGNNNNFSNGNNSKNRIETDNNEITNLNLNFNKFTLQKNVSTKNINGFSNLNADHNNSNINSINENNRRFVHKKGKSNLNGNYNHNFNLFVKPKICVNIINNNNEVNSDNANENSKFIISSRRKNTKSVSTERKISNSVDFSNAKHLKNNLSRTNINTKKANDLNYNLISNSKTNETENDIKNMIQDELANSLVKGSMACPMSPQIHKSNLLNKYINTEENSSQQNSGFICNSSNKILNQNTNLRAYDNIIDTKNASENNFNHAANSNYNSNLSYKKSDNVENTQGLNKAKEAQKKTTKSIIITRTYSELARGIISPKDKNKNNCNNFSDQIDISNAHFIDKHNYYSDKNIHFSNMNNNNNHLKDNKEKNCPNNNKYYKINYNIRCSNASKNSNLNAIMGEKKSENSAVDENSLKSKSFKNKISINYLKKPNLRINSACNLNIHSIAQQKGKNKPNNYLSKISKALLMRQSPKEIDKKNFQLDYLVSKPQMTEFNQRIEKNKFNKNNIILSNNLDLMQSNYNNGKFYNEIKTATSLENLNSEEDDDNEAENIEEGENFNPIHLHLTTEKDYNNNCEPYEFEENCNNFENIDHRILLNINNDYEKETKNRSIEANKINNNFYVAGKFEEKLNYLKPETRILKDSKSIKIKNEENENCAIIKCLETTLSSFDNYNLVKEENLDLNFTEEEETKGIYEKDFDFNSRGGNRKYSELISDRGEKEEVNSALDLNSKQEKKTEVVVNNYKRRINSNIFPKLQGKIAGNSVSQGNKFFEKFILERTENKNTNDYTESATTNHKNYANANDYKNNKTNYPSVNIYKRKKSVYNGSNNIPLKLNSSGENDNEHIKSNLIIKENNPKNNNAQSKNFISYCNKNLIKIETNEDLISDNNGEKKKNFNKNNNTNDPNNFNKNTKDSNNFSDINSNNLNNTNKLTSANADSMSDFKRNFSPRNFSLINKENPKQSEYHISFDTNPSAFQSNKTPLNSNINNNNNVPNPYKVRKAQKNNNKKNDEENNFESPEELHFYYVKTFQKGKNMIVNFD